MLRKLTHDDDILGLPKMVEPEQLSSMGIMIFLFADAVHGRFRVCGNGEDAQPKSRIGFALIIHPAHFELDGKVRGSFPSERTGHGFRESHTDRHCLWK